MLEPLVRFSQEQLFWMTQQVSALPFSALDSRIWSMKGRCI